MVAAAHRTCIAFAVLLALPACRSQPPDPPDNQSDADSVPVIGGPCTYTQVSFRATVDSIHPDGRLLVQAPDSLARTLRMCLLDAGRGRWWAPAPASGTAIARGQAVEVAGEVIATGTCTPCYLGSLPDSAPSRD